MIGDTKTVKGVKYICGTDRNGKLIYFPLDIPQSKFGRLQFNRFKVGDKIDRASIGDDYHYGECIIGLHNNEVTLMEIPQRAF